MAGTTVAAPLTTVLTMPPRIVREVRVRIPPGPRGQVGWYLASGGVQVVPWLKGTYIVADDETIDWPLEGQIESGAWQLVAYNTGSYDHTLYLTFLLDVLRGRTGAPTGSAPIVLEA
jgi:hypothetical protein